jgi:hypothetical protein
LISIAAALIYIPTNKEYEGHPPVLQSLPAFIVVFLMIIIQPEEDGVSMF